MTTTTAAAATTTTTTTGTKASCFLTVKKQKFQMPMTLTWSHKTLGMQSG